MGTPVLIQVPSQLMGHIKTGTICGSLRLGFSVIWGKEQKWCCSFPLMFLFNKNWTFWPVRLLPVQWISFLFLLLYIFICYWDFCKCNCFLRHTFLNPCTSVRSVRTNGVDFINKCVEIVIEWQLPVSSFYWLLFVRGQVDRPDAADGGAAVGIPVNRPITPSGFGMRDLKATKTLGMVFGMFFFCWYVQYSVKRTW